MNKLILKRVRLTLPVALILLLCGVGGNAQTKWPGEDVLGCGYDVWGKYASQESLKDYCLFDFPDSSTTADDSRASYRDPVPETVFLRHIGKNEAKTVKGNSRKEYAESLAAKAGLSGGTFFFRGSVEGSFGTAQSSTEQEFYFTYMDVIVKWKISLDTRSPEVLRSMMEPRFAIDLEEMAPEDLFATYGTHYVATAYLGGRADFTSLSTFREEAETREIAAAVELRYKAIKGNAEYSSDSERGLRESNTTEKLTVIGGNSEYANDIGDKEQYRLWASGMEEMPVLCDFVGEGSLRPVWELTTDESRKAKLEEVFEQMKKANPLPEKVPITPLVAQSPVEAVLVHPKNNKAYFFKGDKYYRFGFDPDKVEGPFTIDEDGWAVVPSDVDAALVHPKNNKAYFFKGDKYYRFDFDPDKVDGVGTIGKHGWAGVPSVVDAALVHPKNNKAYFFKGDKYYRFSFDPDKVEGPFTIGEDGWAGVPSDVDAALVHPKNNKAYFFKGDKYYRFSFDPDKVEGPFTIGEDGWAGVPSSAALPIQ